MDIRLVEPPRRSSLQWWPWLFVFLVVLLMAFVRYRLLDMPLERDEGEYACAAQLILNGIPPYQQVWNMKLPGTYFGYALGMAAFGQTPAGIHATLIVVNSLTIIFVFLLGRRLFGTTAGLAACAAYGVLSASPAVFGLAGHANQFVMLFAVWGAWQLWKAEEFCRWYAFFFTGLLFGLAFLMKQQGICFCLFAAAIVLWHALQGKTVFRPLFWGKLFFLGLGMALPLALVCVYLGRAGVFSKFWFWAFDYARSYAAELTPSQGIQNFLDYSRRTWPLYFPFLGVVLVSLPFVFRDRALRPQIIFAAAFFFFSAAGTSIDFYFRENYFILLLPALAVLVGLAIVSLQFAAKSNASKIIPPAICLFILAGSLYQMRRVFFELPPLAACRAVYAGDASYADMLVVGDYIRAHSGAGDTLAVIGSEPEIYFYARRRPATGFLYTYPLIEHQPYAAQMRAEMIGDIETNKPEFLVFVNSPKSGADRDLFGWFAKYSGAFYDRVAVVEQTGPDHTRFVSDNSIKNYHRTGPNYVAVFRRRTD